MQLDEKKIPALNIAGYGGCEKTLAPIFLGYKHVDKPLHDFEHCKNPTDMIEVKKQVNCQWFDIGKYHDISPHERQIKMTFALHKEGRIITLFYIPLGKMLELLCSDPEYRKYGWTQENIEECAALKRSFPSMQVKVKLPVKTFYKKYQRSVETVYTVS